MHLRPLAVSLVLMLGIGACVLSARPALSDVPLSRAELFRITRDSAILTALERLRGSGAEPALSAIANRRGRVFFKDLREISKQVRNFDALSWISPAGEWVIFIHVKHRNAPPEALAALIAHESLHCDPENSLQEEVSGWAQEAMTWSEMKQRYPHLQTLAPGTSPLVDRLNRLASEQEQGMLEALVRQNKGYRNLPETSPGFDPQTVTQHKRYPLKPPAPPRPAFEMNDPPETFWDS